MPSSHPPSLLVVAERTLREKCKVPPGSRVLLAVSGGGDSMAMLHVMASLSNRLGLELHAHGVDHGLRSEAQAELEGARRLAQSLGVPFSSSRIAVLPGGNLQARARNQRFVALRQVAQTLSMSFVATAHHADDRAETVLIRLMRGSGPVGLAVLPPQAQDLLRPLICARRDDIRLHLERHRIQFAEDPSNKDPRYLRSRIRHHILPAISRESPGIVGHLNSLADRMLELDEANIVAPLGLTRSQAEALQRIIQRGCDGAEIALAGGWVLKLERKSIRPDSAAELP